MKTLPFTSYSKVLVLSLITLMTSCKETMKPEDNLLLQEWKGPYGGVPAFDQMTVNDIQEAVETGMELNLSEIEAIANSTERSHV